MEDHRATQMTLRQHPLFVLRDELSSGGVIPCLSQRDVEDGRPVVPRDRRPANMPRSVARLDASLLGAPLGVLDGAARRSRGREVATIEVRLAVLVVHRHARDRDRVRSLWSRAAIGNRTADEGFAEPLQVIRQRRVSSGWIAPSHLLQPMRT